MMQLEMEVVQPNTASVQLQLKRECAPVCFVCVCVCECVYVCGCGGVGVCVCAHSCICFSNKIGTSHTSVFNVDTFSSYLIGYIYYAL